MGNGNMKQTMFINMQRVFLAMTLPVFSPLCYDTSHLTLLYKAYMLVCVIYIYSQKRCVLNIYIYIVQVCNI